MAPMLRKALFFLGMLIGAIAYAQPVDFDITNLNAETGDPEHLIFDQLGTALPEGCIVFAIMDSLNDGISTPLANGFPSADDDVVAMFRVCDGTDPAYPGTYWKTLASFRSTEWTPGTFLWGRNIYLRAFNTTDSLIPAGTWYSDATLHNGVFATAPSAAAIIDGWEWPATMTHRTAGVAPRRIDASGSASWTIGAVVDIPFLAVGLTGSIAIDIQRNNPSTTWSEIGTALVTDTVFHWTVSGPATSNARLRIRSVEQPTLVSQYTEQISISAASGITISHPQNGDTTIVGRTFNIRWRASGLTGNVTGQLDRNYPSGTWETLFTSPITDTLYTWTVTGPTTNMARVRLISVTEPTMGDTSFSEFLITAPAITVTYPAASYDTIGVPIALHWTSQYITGNVRISVNRRYPNGVWSTIMASTPNDGIEAWIPVGPATDSLKVRIESIDNPAIYTISDVYSHLVNPTMMFTSTTLGESPSPTIDSVIIGRTVNIGFNLQQSLVGTVSLKLNRTYPTGTWETIASNIPVTDTLRTWVSNRPISNQARFRLVSSYDTSAHTSSTHNFVVYAPTINVTYPNGGETFIVGTNDTIRWNSFQVTGNVRIYLSRTVGNWTLLADNVPNTGVLGGTVTEPASTTAKVKIVSITDTLVSSTSANYFTIALPTIALNRPAGNENFVIGRPENVIWHSSHLSGTVRILVNRNYPSGTWDTVAIRPAADTVYSWLVSGTTGTFFARMKIESVEMPSVFVVGANNFRISIPTLTLLRPIGAENYVIGSTETIRWSSLNITDSIRVDINRSYPDTVWTTLGTYPVTTTTVNWVVTGPATSTARIRLTSREIPSLTNMSPANFAIVAPTISVTRPNTALTFVVGHTETINFNASFVSGSIRVLLDRSYPSGTYDTLATVANTATSLQWLVTEPVTTTARIRVESVDNTSVFAVSSSNFSIVLPMLTLSGPNGGEVLIVGKNDTLRWEQTDLVGRVLIELNRSYPTGTWDYIDSVLATQGNYIWSVTAPVTTTARFRISSLAVPSIGDTSNNNFQIRYPSITVTRPNGAEQFVLFTTQPITWTTQYIDTGYVNIQINRNYPTGAWDLLALVPATSDTFNWLATGVTSIRSRIRVIYRGMPTIVGDTSNANFSIVYPTITGIQPGAVANDVLMIGKPFPIRWFAPNLDTTVNIQINRNYPSTTWEQIARVPGRDTLYNWTVTGPIAASARIRVQSVRNPSIVADTSDFNFAVVKGLTITYPNGGEQVSNNITVRWTHAAQIADTSHVVLEVNEAYPGTNWRSIGRPLAVTDTFAWTIRDSAWTETARFRISLVGFPLVADSSDANCFIRGVSAPEQLVVLPKEFALQNAYPNPFNNSISFAVAVPREAEVKIRIFNMLGQQVAMVHTGRINAGYHRFIWNATGNATGTYIVRMEAPNFTKVRMIQYIR